MLVNTVLASFLITGSVSWLYYSDRLMEFPLGVFGIALATVILPSLSREHAAESPETFSRMLDWALRWVFLIGVPASVGLMVMAEPMITTLFRYGAFVEQDVVKTAQALVVFAAGLLGFILVKVLAPGFYARHDTATPAKIAAVAFGANIILSLMLVWPLKHVGLALAISIAAYLNAGMLFLRLRQINAYEPGTGWWWLYLRVAIASGVMAFMLYSNKGDLSLWLAGDVYERVFRLAFWIIAGFVVYVLIMVALGTRPAELKLDIKALEK